MVSFTVIAAPSARTYQSLDCIGNAEDAHHHDGNSGEQFEAHCGGIYDEWIFDLRGCGTTARGCVCWGQYIGTQESPQRP